MHLIIVLVLCILFSTFSFRVNTIMRVETRASLKVVASASAGPSVPAGEPRVTAFDRKVYDACTRVPKGKSRSSRENYMMFVDCRSFIGCVGKVTTYKEIAREVGSPHAHRAVGSSLRRNPFAPQVVRAIKTHVLHNCQRQTVTHNISIHTTGSLPSSCFRKSHFR